MLLPSARGQKLCNKHERCLETRITRPAYLARRLQPLRRRERERQKCIMAALSTRAEQALAHAAAATETTSLLRTRPTVAVVARCAGPRSALAALASATARPPGSAAAARRRRGARLEN